MLNWTRAATTRPSRWPPGCGWARSPPSWWTTTRPATVGPAVSRNGSPGRAGWPAPSTAGSTTRSSRRSPPRTRTSPRPWWPGWSGRTDDEPRRRQRASIAASASERGAERARSRAMSTVLDVPVDMRGAFARTVSELLDTDPAVALVLADISADLFRDELRSYPERVLNVGIREQLLISVAGGLALTGLRPIAQIKLDLVHQDAGAILVSVGASYDWPAGGRTHQSPGDVALLDTLPGVRVHVPGHPEDAARLLRAEAGRDGVAYLRLSAAANAQPQPGSGLRLVRPGRRGLVVAVGPMLDPVLAAAKALSGEGIHVAVAYLDTVRPFDGAGLRAALADVASPEVVLVEPYLAGTSSHAVSEALTGRAHRLLSLGVHRDAELRVYGDAADHDRAHGLDPASLAVEVLAFLAC